jgi:hypothetical protein
LPIFSQSSSVKNNSIQMPSTTLIPNSNPNTTPILFAITPQMLSFAQNSSGNNISNSPSSSPTQAIPSLDVFFAKFGESDSTREFIQFKSVFEDERITVDQIYDLTDAEFDQLGVKKIGWRKAFRAAAKRYK